MRYVILRDDDTSALTPIDGLERLYRPFLERGLPVNLATIPNVRTDVTLPDGGPEGFLVAKNGDTARSIPIGSNGKLVRYLQANPGFHVVQHGYHHAFNEFDTLSRNDVVHRLEQGANLLLDAGFSRPQTFVAPYDRLSRVSLAEVAGRFRVLSTGWFELRRLPWSWWPRYVLKKARRASHWRIGRAILLTHPGCLLSYLRPLDTMLGSIQQTIASQKLTVLVTHWWEYFRNNAPDEAFIRVLHQTADYLAHEPGIKVISFDDVTPELMGG
jgi:uncharacterized protein DUF2334